MFEEKIKALYPAKRGASWDLAWKLGFPSREVEAYRKVPMHAVSKFPIANIGEIQVASKVSKPCLFMPMAEAKRTYGVFLENRMKGRLSKETNFFAALTEAVYEQGYFLYVPLNVQGEVELTFTYTGSDAYFAPHLQVFCGRGSAVKVKFASFGCGMISQLIDIYMDKNSVCEFVDEAKIDAESIYMNAVRGSLKQDSRLTYWSSAQGSKFFRGDFQVELLESGCEATLKGAAELIGDNVSHTEVRIEHLAEHTKSNQHFKMVLHDQSRGSFEGKIFVDSVAQKTEAYQLNNNLLLGEKSTVFTKPNLEIFADDVKATHGATVTRLSEEELFYFQSRGIGKEKAGAFLAKGFLKEVLYAGI